MPLLSQEKASRGVGAIQAEDKIKRFVDTAVLTWDRMTKGGLWIVQRPTAVPAPHPQRTRPMVGEGSGDSSGLKPPNIGSMVSDSPVLTKWIKLNENSDLKMKILLY